MADLKHTYDHYIRKDPAIIYLAKPGKRLYCALNGVDTSTASLSIRTNNTAELTFAVDKYIEGELSNGYDYIDEQMELYCDGIWFKIIDPPIINNDGLCEIKEITAESYEIMLTQYKLMEFAINTGGEESYEMQYKKEHEQDKFYQVKFHNPHEPKLSLLDLVLLHTDVPSWKVGYVDDITQSDEGILLADEICNFEVDEKDVYAFLTQDVAPAYKCIFEFDTQNMLINVYRTESIGKDTNITIGFRNIQDSVTITRDDNLVTQFYVDKLGIYDIAGVNFSTRVIDDLSNFVREPYMPHDLQIKYKAWVDYRESLRPEFIKLSKEYNHAVDVMSEIDLRVPIDSAKNDWQSSKVEDLKSAYDDNAAIIKGLESTYVNDEGNFDLDALKKSPDWSLYESIMNYTLPAIVAALQAKNEPVEGFGKGNIISNINPVTLGKDWITEGKNIATFTTVQVNDSPAYGITRGVNVKFSNASGKAGILHSGITVESGQEYVLSCYAKGIGTIYLEYGTPGENRQVTEFHIGSGWTRVYISYRANSKITDVAFTGTSDFTVCGMQLEMGITPSQFGYFTQSEDTLKAYETDWKLYGLRELKTKLDVYEGCIDELKKDGYADPYDPLSKYEESYHSQMHQKYLDYLQLKEQCEAALKERQAEYDAAKPTAVQERRQKIADAVLLENFGRNVDGTDLLQLDSGVLCFKDNINVDIDEKGVLSIEDTFVNVEAIDGVLTLSYTDTPFTEDELLIIKSLYNQATYTNENIIVTNLDDTVDAVDKQKRLYDDAVEQLYVESHPQYTYTNSINNILALPEFQEFHEDLEVNNFIRLGITDTDYVKLRIIEINYNPCDLDEQMEITFSNMVQYKSKRNDFNTLLDESINRASRNGGRVESVNKSDTTDYVITADVIKNIFSNPLFQSMLNGSTVGGAGSGGTINANTIITELIKADEGIFKKLTADTAFIKYLDAKLVSADRVVTKIIEADEAIIKKLSATIITASEINADVANIKNLIAGNAGVGNLQTINLTAKNVTIDDAVIKDLIAAKISVADLMAHTATAELITLISSDGRPTIAFKNSTQQFYDSSGNVRVQIGQDGNGDFNFVVRGTDGTTALFDSHGIKQEGIPDNTIITKMISDKQITPNKASWNVEVDENGNQVTSIENIYMGNGEKFGVKYNEIIENIEGTKTTVSEIKSIVDEQAKVIENKVSKTEIDTYIEGNTKVTEMRDQIAQQTIDINGITTTVSDVQSKLSDTEKTLNAHTTQINQTATTLSLIATGDTESSLTITDKFISLVSDGVIGIAAEKFNIDALTTFMNNSKDGSSTVINGGSIITNTITADKLVADILTSKNYKGPLSGDRFAQAGTKYLLSDGTITSRNFVIDSEGNVYVRGNGEFTGKITASQGNIAGFTIKANYIAKGTETIHGANNSVYIGTDGISCGTNFWVDSNGKMNATDGTFSGTLSGATGTFSGDLSAAGGTFRGSLTAATGTFSGDLSAAGGTFTGTLTGVDGDFSGTITAHNGVIGGFTISSDSLYSGSDYLGGSGVYVSPNGISCGDFFKVNSTGASINGNITAKSISIYDKAYLYNSTLNEESLIIDFNPVINDYVPDEYFYDIRIGDIKNNCYIAYSSDIGGWLNFHSNAVSFMDCNVIELPNKSIDSESISWMNYGYGAIHGHDHYRMRTGNGEAQLAFIQLNSSDSNSYSLRPYRVTSSGTDAVSGMVSLGSDNARFKALHVNQIYLNGSLLTQGGGSGGGGIINATATTSTLAAGSNATVSTKVNGNTVAFTFGIPRGAKGDTGPRGATGAKGDPGNASSGGFVSATLQMANSNGYNVSNTSGSIVTGMYMNSSNNIIIGDNSYKTIIRGTTIQLGNVSSTTVILNDGATVTSDGRLKKDFNSLDKYENWYMSLNPLSYKYKEGTSDRFHIGFIAQEVVEALENCNLTSQDFAGYVKCNPCEKSKLIDTDYVLGLRYEEFISMNTYMAQKAHRRLDELENENQELKNMLLQLQGEISILKQKMEETTIC